MGILNVTPDSFSDGGLHATSFHALEHAHRMLEQGADIIDVGGESTRPGSAEVAPAEEWARVAFVVESLAAKGVCVSVDTRHPKVASACLAQGASIINDITGFTDPAMRALAAGSNAGCVIMHLQGNPSSMQQSPRYDDVTLEVSTFLLAQAELLVSAGVSQKRICLDPGPGFGKDFAHNLTLLKRTAHFASLRRTPSALRAQTTAQPESSGLSRGVKADVTALTNTHPFLLMAAWSRKRFLGELTGEVVPAKRQAASVAAALYAASQGAGVVRVHDVAETVQALKVWEALHE